MRRFCWILLGPTLVSVAAMTTGCRRETGAGAAGAEGRRLYDSSCAKCHGRDGRGGVPAAEGLPAPRNFCDVAFQRDRSDSELRRVIVQGKGPMPPFGSLFDDSQLALLVAHIRGFNPERADAR